MADAVKEALGIETDFIPGGKGIFEMKLDGQIVWTNDDRRGVKPSNEEAVEAVRAVL